VFCLAETLKIFLSERNCNIVGMMTGWSSTKFLYMSFQSYGTFNHHI